MLHRCTRQPPLQHSPMLGTNRCSPTKPSASMLTCLGKPTNWMADLPSLLEASNDDWSHELSRPPTQERPPNCRPENASTLLRRTCIFSQENCTVYWRQLTSNVTCQLCATISASKRSSSITGKFNRFISPETPDVKGCLQQASSLYQEHFRSQTSGQRQRCVARLLALLEILRWTGLYDQLFKAVGIRLIDIA